MERAIVGSIVWALVAAASASPPGPDSWVPLGRFPIVQAEQGWGSLGFDQSVQGNPLQIGSRLVRGYGTHSPGKMTFDLHGMCSWFKVRLDLNREVAYTKKGSVDFSIWGDGRRLFDSGIVRVTDAGLPLPVTVNVKGVRKLELVSGDAGDGLDSDHADWLEPEVLLTYPQSFDGKQSNLSVRTSGISVQVDRMGTINGLKLPTDRSYRAVTCSTGLLGSTTIATSTPRRLPNGGVETHLEVEVDGRPCWITERLEPFGKTIRWQFFVKSTGPSWSVPITTQIQVPHAARQHIWMPWNDPRDSHRGLTMGESSTPWNDPLVYQSFRNRIYSYGETSNGNWWTGDLITLPLLTISDGAESQSFSWFQAPDDRLPRAQISTGNQGWVDFVRQNRRLGNSNVVSYTMYLACHPTGFRSALRQYVQMFPKWFDPPNPQVTAFSGCGAYSSDERGLDAKALARLRRMDFRTMWKLSDDYAYMGMFLPPIQHPDQRWNRIDDSGSPPNYKATWTSARRLNNFAGMLRSSGFHLLSYFNVVEFGANMKRVSSMGLASPWHSWENPSEYLARRFPTAPICPNGTDPEGAWQGGWALDPGDPGYRAHLLEQADRHLRWIPESEGICIDRVDYTNQFNIRADDRVTFADGKPARSLVQSWIDLLSELGPKMHQAKKVIFSNLMNPRIDLARHLDGVYAEFGNQPTVSNGLSFICLNKPLLAWTRNEDMLSDAFFQRHLYMGVHPTAPYPTNNHCIEPSPERDRWYETYGPLFRALNGRKWVLEPQPIQLIGDGKANLFQVPGGYAAVIISATRATATIALHLRAILRNAQIRVLTPGSPDRVWNLGKVDPNTNLAVPTKRGCAVVLILPRGH